MKNSQVERTPFVGLVVIAVIAAVCIGACKHPDPEPLKIATKNAYYFWQIEADLPPSKDLLAAHSALLYVRLFDLDAEGGTVKPRAVRHAVRAEYEIIPVVYMTVKALRIQNEPEALARKTLRLVRELVTSANPAEIQIDADWTRSTRKHYFSFLNALKQELKESRLPWKVSATIRLHQLMDKSMGLPPVDRGMLMIYNTGRVTDPLEKNSILNREKTMAYLRHAGSYPLPLDLALPDFAWAVAFVHGSFHALLSGVEQENARPHILAIDSYRFQLKKDLSLGGMLLPENTVLRFEKVDSQDRMEILKELKSLPALADRRLVIFDYQKERTSRNMEELERLFQLAGSRP
ncbi:MAG: hypothetical protein HS115_02735 [Spirochaetales bacterium]|nr:hypothetical protein [Spirochaetales bacterium]